MKKQGWGHPVPFRESSRSHLLHSSALFARSLSLFAKSRNSSHVLSITCALFTKKCRGVTPVSCRDRFPKRAVFAASSICRGRRLEVRDEKQHGQQSITAGDKQIDRMNSMLQIQKHGGQKISKLLQNADQHQRPEAHRIRSNYEKYKLPRQRYSGVMTRIPQTPAA